MSFQTVSPVLVVPPETLTTGYSLYSGGDTPPLLSLALPVDILHSFNDFFFFFSLAAFQKQRHLIIISASPSMLSLCCTSTNVTLFDGL